MTRKFILALAATAAIGAAALAPTAASASPWHHNHHHGWHHGHHGWYGGYGVGFYGPGYVYGGNCYIVRRVVWTSWGKRIRRVEVCS